MAVYLNSISFKNEIDSTPVNWTLANIGEKIIIEHDISVKEYTLSSTNTPWIFNNQDGYPIYAGQPWITGGDFSKFDTGTTLTYYDSAANNFFGLVIVEKLSNTEIRLSSNPGGWAAGEVGTTNVLSVSNPITSLAYKWNFIENNEATNYLSKVDGTMQMATITGLNAAAGGLNKPMTFIGDLPYQIGSIVVDEVSLVTTYIHSANFKVRHTTRITPTMLAEHWDDIQANVKPNYFFNLACLKSIFFFEARYNLTDPNNIQTLESDTTLGNTGWFNENFNTSLTNYTKNSLVYTNALTNVVTPKAQCNLDGTNFTFNISNTVNSPFVAGQTKLVINFCKAPNDELEYKANGRDLLHNFVWESALLTVQSAPIAVNGDNYNDLKIRSLSNLKATLSSASVITVTGKLAFDQLGIDVFSESNEPRYMFWVSIQDHTKVGVAADRANVLIDSAPFFYQSEFPNLIGISQKLIPHTVENFIDNYLSLPTFTEDELIGYSTLTIVPDPLVTSLQLTRVTHRVIAYDNLTGERFTLESKTIQLPNNSFISGYQFFDFLLAKNIHVPANEIRKNILSQRDPSNLTYIFAYPYLNRWEYWEKLIGVHSDFFDPSNPHNNFNHDWVKYSVGIKSWMPRYELEIAAKVNGIPALYSKNYEYEMYDRNLKLTMNFNINTFDGATPLSSAGKKYILGYKNTLVKATFSLSGGEAFTQTNTHVVLGIEIYEEGGVTGKRRMSSKYLSDSDTWFVPLTGSTQTRLTFTAANTCVAEAEIDFTKLNIGKARWKLTARIYDSIINGNLLASQDVHMIPKNFVDDTPTVLTPKALQCCDDDVWRVLADTASSDELKNDKNRVLWWFSNDVVDTAVLSLVNSNGTVIPLTGVSTYGTPYDYGFFINGFNEKLIGYELDWKKVLTTLGEDTYYVKCDVTTIFGGSNIQYSATYCLKQYTNARANGTVRIEYTNSGLLGSTSNDEKIRGYDTLKWYNQHRFQGHFRFKSAALKEEDILYTSGQRQYVEMEQEPEYILKLKPIVAFKHDILMVDILMADSKMITDYNDNNFDNYYKKKVIAKSGYEPNIFDKQSKLASVEITFIQEFNNRKKFRS